MNKKEEIIAKYNSGVSVIELSKEYSLSRERIYQYLRQVPDFKKLSKEKRLKKVEKRLEGYRHLLPQIFALREKGVGNPRIAKQLGVTYVTIQKLTEGTPYDSSKKAQAKRNRAINKAYLSGLSQVKIAKKFGMSQSSISIILLKTNNGRLPERPSSRR